MASALAVVIAVLLDRWLGEPRRWHPLNGFAVLAGWVERRLYASTTGSVSQRVSGIAALIILLLPPTVLFAWLGQQSIGGWLIGVLVLYLAIGWRSLIEHAGAVAGALKDGDLDQSCELCGHMVGRDTAAMNESAITGATLESVLENGNDAIFGAIFWFLVGGAGGVVAYRLANTLDALWGYRNDRYRDFGWAAARFDDVLNFIPARLTAFGYILCGNALYALYRIARQAYAWPSSNAGWVMAAGGCALNRQLGGQVSYQGVLHERPSLGKGDQPDRHDIDRGLKLLRHNVLLWLAIIVMTALLGTGYA